MESVTFDGLTRKLGGSLTRRGALRSLFASAAAITGGSVLLQTEDATARRRRRKHKAHKRRRQHDRCGRHGDGCGAYDADSGEFTPPYCCHGYYCHYDPNGGTWTCRAE